MSSTKHRGSSNSSSQSEIFSTNSNYALFVGKNFNYYFSKWSELLNKKCKGDLDILRKSRINQVSWNLWAFVFGIFWFAYRKMYLWAITSFITLTFIPWVGWVQCFIIGFYGNRLYFQFVDKKVKKLEEEIKNDDVLKAEIIKAGSTSKLAVFIAVVVTVIVLSLLPSSKKHSFKSAMPKDSGTGVSYFTKRDINSIPFTFGFNATTTTVEDIVANLAGGDGKVEWKKEDNNYFINIDNSKYRGYLMFSYNENTNYIFLSGSRVDDKLYGGTLCIGFRGDAIRCLERWLTAN